jgi:hypothetical protein
MILRTKYELEGATNAVVKAKRGYKVDFVSFSPVRLHSRTKDGRTVNRPAHFQFIVCRHRLTLVSLLSLPAVSLSSNLHVPETMMGLSRKQILKELRFAVMAWASLYGIMFVALLLYRYNTHNYYTSQKSKAEELLQASAEAKVVKKRVVKQVPRENPLQAYETKLDEMTQELTTAHHSVQAKLETLHRYLETLEHWKASSLLNDDIARPVTPETEMQPLDHWQQLLSMPSLQDVSSSEELELLFGKAMGEVEAALKEPSKIDWDQIQQSLVNANRQDSEWACPSVKTNRRRRRQKYPNAAYESDLQQILKELDDYFTKRTPSAGVRALGDESRMKLRDETVEGASRMLQDVVQFLDETERRVAVAGEDAMDRSSCDIDLEMVTALVDAGLKAMAVHGDVREALRKTTLEYDPSINEDDLILDADLPLTSSETELTSTVINLRSAIETPVLIKAMDWIDDLVDLVGGYNDRLDQYLDSLTHGQGESVGEVIVERLLHNAGLIDIDVKQVGDKIKLSPFMQRKIIEKFA